MSDKFRKSYTEEFKKQMVSLYESGKKPAEIIREYDLSPASIYQWIKKYGSESQDDVNKSNKEPIKELKQLREENQKLKMEVDILKQAALIMGENKNN